MGRRRQGRIRGRTTARDDRRKGASMTAELDNYIDFVKQIEKQALEVLDGLPPEALNWRPLPEAPGVDAHATNSLAVMAAHLAGSMRHWVGEVAGGRPAHRDRDAEFRAQASQA